MSGLPSARWVVLSKRPGHIPVCCTKLLDEDAARAHLISLFGRTTVRSVQYALAELTIVEQYR